LRRNGMAEYPYLLNVEADWPNVPAKTITAKLQIYFQSKKRSHGGDCVVRYSDQSRTAAVHFKAPEHRLNVLAKGDHTVTINDQELILVVREPTDTENRTENTIKSVSGK
uniref:PAR14-like first RRM domain-containing protein n=1 Tax=Electrophorus electricus TaxID=8005 RepID=A0A4W4DSQ2_ELEEL